MAFTQWHLYFFNIEKEKKKLSDGEVGEQTWRLLRVSGAQILADAAVS